MHFFVSTAVVVSCALATASLFRDRGALLREYTDVVLCGMCGVCGVEKTAHDSQTLEISWFQEHLKG